MSTNPEQLLLNPDIVPTNEVLTVVLAGTFPVWQLLVAKLAEMGITVEWRYYRDGKAWLGKCVSGKKTVLWVSVWKGYFRMSLFFTEKTRVGLQNLPIAENIKVAIAAELPRGKLIPLLIDVHDEKQLPDAFTLIDYKRKARI